MFCSCLCWGAVQSGTKAQFGLCFCLRLLASQPRRLSPQSEEQQAHRNTLPASVKRPFLLLICICPSAKVWIVCKCSFYALLLHHEIYPIVIWKRSPRSSAENAEKFIYLIIALWFHLNLLVVPVIHNDSDIYLQNRDRHSIGSASRVDLFSFQSIEFRSHYSKSSIKNCIQANADTFLENLSRSVVYCLWNRCESSLFLWHYVTWMLMTSWCQAAKPYWSIAPLASRLASTLKPPPQCWPRVSAGSSGVQLRLMHEPRTGGSCVKGEGLNVQACSTLSFAFPLAL